MSSSRVRAPTMAATRTPRQRSSRASVLMAPAPKPPPTRATWPWAGRGAGGAVEVGDRHGHALAVLADADHDELARLGVAGDERRLDHEQLRDGRQVSFEQDARHQR